MEKRNRYEHNRLARFLTDIYEKDLEINSYLRQLGFSDEQTRHLIRYCKDDIVGAIREGILTYLVMKQQDRRFTDLIIDRYGLSDIAENYSMQSGQNGAGGEIEGQKFNEALRILRDQKAKTFFENNLRDQLTNILKLYPISIPVLKDEPLLEETEIVYIKPEKNKSFSINLPSPKYPRAYMTWTDEEERLLMEMILEGMTPKEIAKKLQRKTGGITSRIKKMKKRNS